MFDAVVVGVGCVGIIHGVLIEAEPMYYLEFQELTVDKKQIGDGITSLRVAQIGIVGYEEDEVPFDVTYTVNIFGEMAVARAIKKVRPEDASLLHNPTRL